MENVTRFEVQRRSLIRYQLFNNLLGTLFIGASFAVLPVLIGLDEGAGAAFYWWTAGIIGALMLFSILFALWYAPRSADALKYWIEGGLLRVNQGVFNYKYTSVPLDRVTDVVLTQGIVMRAFGIWTMRVQTAGDGAGTAEATMVGIGDAESARVELLAARKALLKG